MACRLFGIKLLLEPMMSYCQLHPHERNSVTFFIEIKKVSLTKLHFKMSSAKVTTILSRSQCVKATLNNTGKISYESTRTDFTATKKPNRTVIIFRGLTHIDCTIIIEGG